jgi:hypothetical protein
MSEPESHLRQSVTGEQVRISDETWDYLFKGNPWDEPAEKRLPKDLDWSDYEADGQRMNDELGLEPLVVECPYCHQPVHDTEADIDSGLRKHVEHCDLAPDQAAE